MDRISILDVAISTTRRSEVLQRIDTFLTSDHQHYIVTPNPEFLVAASRNPQFKAVLNYADLAVADGIGVVLAARFLGINLERITGVDLVWMICEKAAEQQKSVYFLGAAPGLATAAAQELKKSIPGLIVAGYTDGGIITSTGESENKDLIATINQTQPDVIIVAFGQVKQECWIFKHLDQLTSVKLAIGVGGAIDYIAGAVNRAPSSWRRLGLEWLYRLIKEPRRFKRIINAVIVFPFLFVKNYLFEKHG